MVARCPQMTPTRQVAVVDLDGTYIKCNSFSRFVMFAACRTLRAMRLPTFIRIIRHVILRKLRRITHAEAKQRIVAAVRPVLTSNDINRFTASLTARRNANVARLCAQLRAEGHILLLATAAPDIYARTLAQSETFDDVIATGQEEMCGERKRDAVLAFTNDLGVRLAVVITDHANDLPLMQANADGRNIIVNPSALTLRRVKDAGISYSVLF